MASWYSRNKGREFFLLGLGELHVVSNRGVASGRTLIVEPSTG
jgi:hypothetical protein